jgi:hypothetical protein
MQNGDTKGVLFYDQTQGVAQSKEKLYAKQSTLCKEQMGVQD